MCGGVIEDILDPVGDLLEGVGDIVSDAVEFVGDTVEHIIEDPLPAIIDIGLISIGVPPVYAGAIGGAVGAAENGGNILEGALVGGASGYAGGAGAGWAAEAGAGDFLSGAAGGAASGATGAALTGGDILQGAAGGGFVGGVGGSAFGGGYGQGDGSQAPVYEFNPYDGSLVEVSPYIPPPPPAPPALPPVEDLSPTTINLSNPNASIGWGPAPIETPPIDYTTYGPPAPPYEPPYTPPSEPAVRDIPSTGYSDSDPGTVYNGPNGPEVVLDSGKTVLISDLEKAINSGSPISVDGQMTTGGTTPGAVEIGGLPRSIENPGSGALPEGTELVSIDNSDGARWNDDLGTYVNPNTGAYFDQEANAWVRSTTPQPTTPVEGGGPGYPTNEVVDNGNGTSTTYNPNGSMTITWPDGTSMTTNPDGSSIIRNPNGSTELVDLPSAASTVGTPTLGVPTQDLPDVGPVGPVDTGPVAPVDIPPVDNTPEVVITDTRPTTPVVETPPVITPGPIVPPTEPDVPEVTITDTRPVKPVEPPVITPPPPEVPEVVITDTRPPKEIVDPLPPPDVPEVVITDTRPTTPVVPEPPVITPPPVDVPPVVPEPPPVVEPPPPPVTPPPVVVVPPVVKPPTPPVVPPDTRVTPPSSYTPIDTGNYLNAGLMQTTPFYKTTSPVQAQYYWGTGPTQYAPAYNRELALSNPNAPATAWGMQQMYKPLTAQELADIAQNNPYSYVAGPVAPGR